MVNPSIDQLTKDRFNRYILVIATAKTAKYVTEKQNAQKELDIKDKDLEKYKSDSERIIPKKELMEEKPVKIAINHLYTGDFKISEKTLKNALNAGKFTNEQ